jgi:MoaA/NifB/PqqE/SkfB family radical SAM enzyme
MTYRCNSRCQICNIWTKPSARELGIREIERIFKSFTNLGWIDLTGGEVTLREDLVEIVRVIAKSTKNLLIAHVSTNGQIPDAAFSMVQEILRSRLVPVVNISVDGPRELNDRLRGVPGAFLRSLETFKRLKKMPKGHYYLSCTISKHNIKHIDELLSELKREISDFNFADIHFNLFHASSHYYANQEVDGASGLDSEEVKKYLSLSKRGHPFKIFLENEYINGISRFLSGARSSMTCQALNTTCFIDPSGIVYPCGIHNRPLGNLAHHEYDIKKLWNEKNSLHVLREIRDGKCPGCWSPCEAYPAILGSAIRNCFVKTGSR